MSTVSHPFLGLAEPLHPSQYRLRDVWLVPAIAIGVIMAVLLPVRMATPVAMTISQNAVIAATNQERLQYGLPLLRADQSLSMAAEAKGEDMLAAGVFAHYYNGHTPWQFIDAAGVGSWKVAGENLAKNYGTTGALMTAWMQSPEHRENILNRQYDHIGVAVIRGTLADGTPISVTVQLFTGG